MQGSSVVLVALFTSVITAAGATYLLQRYPVFPPVAAAPREVPAPSLVGLSEADARANAHALQLPLLVEGREAVAGAKVGTVLRQSVAPGRPVLDSSGIAVVFAESLPNVPRVTELTLEEARKALARHGYRAVQGEPVPSVAVPVGSVVRQAPEADAELTPGSVVTLHLSSGPAEVEAPSLSGLGLRAAQEKLAGLGLQLKVRWISKAETVTGSVLSQKPKAGEKLSPKSTIEVVVNR